MTTTDTAPRILVALAKLGRVTIDATGYQLTIDSPIGFQSVAQLVPSMSAPVPGFGETYACGWLAGVPVRVSLPGGAL